MPKIRLIDSVVNGEGSNYSIKSKEWARNGTVLEVTIKSDGYAYYENESFQYRKGTYVVVKPPTVIIGDSDD